MTAETIDCRRLPGAAAYFKCGELAGPGTCKTGNIPGRAVGPPNGQAPKNPGTVFEALGKKRVKHEPNPEKILTTTRIQ